MAKTYLEQIIVKSRWWSQN